MIHLKFLQKKIKPYRGLTLFIWNHMFQVQKYIHYNIIKVKQLHLV